MQYLAICVAYRTKLSFDKYVTCRTKLYFDDPNLENDYILNIEGKINQNSFNYERFAIFDLNL